MSVNNKTWSLAEVFLEEGIPRHERRPVIAALDNEID